jgi:cell wall-associated NlpC family hydrolase
VNALVQVVTPLAPLHGEPRVSSPQVSQALGGHLLTVLDVRDEWRHVRGEDRYEGWVHAGYLAPLLQPPPESDRLTSLGCTVNGSGGRRRVLPPGAYLLPDDAVESGEAVPADALRRRFPPSPDAAAATARALFEGAPYVWGGVTPWGADCSGLVQTSFRLHGMLLPRDAWQQASRGDEVRSDLRALHGGDLLFFSDREDNRITHVGIAMGDGTMVHSALGRGGFALERLGDRDDLYVERLLSRFKFARRLNDATRGASVS